MFPCMDMYMKHTISMCDEENCQNKQPNIQHDIVSGHLNLIFETNMSFSSIWRRINGKT